MRSFIRPVAAASVLALTATACFGRSHGAGSALRVDVVTDGVQAQSGSGSWRTLNAGDRVSPGDSLRTDAAGSVALLRDDGSRVDLAPSTSARLIDVKKVSLEMGSALVRAKDIALSVVADGVEADAERATYRVDKSFSVRIGSYAGSVGVVEDPDNLTVPVYRQVVIAGGILPRDASPLTYVAKDPWDRLLLADALDVDRQLAQYGRAFKADFADKAASPAFYSGVAPGVPVTFVLRTIHTVSDPADLLFAVVMAKVLSDPGRAGDILALRLNGSAWGLIAKIERVDPKRYVDAVIAALLPQGALAIGQGTPGSGGRDKGETGGTPTPTTSPKPKPSPTTSPSPSPSPTTSPSPSPSPSPCSAIDQLLGRCGGGVLP